MMVQAQIVEIVRWLGYTGHGEGAASESDFSVVRGGQPGCQARCPGGGKAGSSQLRADVRQE